MSTTKVRLTSLSPTLSIADGRLQFHRNQPKDCTHGRASTLTRWFDGVVSKFCGHCNTWLDEGNDEKEISGA